MKKKLVILILALTLTTASITACGNETAPENETETSSGTESSNDAGEESSSSEESTPEPATPEPTVEPTPEPTTEPTPEPTPETEAVVTDEWAVDLYNAVLEDNYTTVMELLVDAENVREHCGTYIDTEWPLFEGQTVFSMLMEDGEKLRVLVFESEEGEWLEISAYVTYHESSVGLGDHCITMYPDGTYAYIKDGSEIVSTNPGMANMPLNEYGWW